MLLGMFLFPHRLDRPWDGSMHRSTFIFDLADLISLFGPLSPFYAPLFASRSNGRPLRRTASLFLPHKPLDLLVQASKRC